nr:hypothetical protein [uncultured Kingella sp.]
MDGVSGCLCANDAQGSLKTKMAWRRLVAKWLMQQGSVDWQNVGKPPTRHRVQILPRFQSKSYLPIRSSVRKI